MATLKATAAELLARLPGKATPQWPGGERFALALAHGTMSVEIYAPLGDDPQTPHAQDELYFIHSGRAKFLVRDEWHEALPGTAFFVPARVEHRFIEPTADFSAWVVFWGPAGGEHSG